MRMIEAALRLAEAHPVWTIPDMNRSLVEEATHPARLERIEGQDPRWVAIGTRQGGQRLAHTQTASHAVLDRDVTFTRCVIPRDERFATRLGSNDRQVVFDRARQGPFGAPIGAVKIPGFLAADAPTDAAPTDVTEAEGRIEFRFGQFQFLYDRHGLRRGPVPT